MYYLIESLPNNQKIFKMKVKIFKIILIRKISFKSYQITQLNLLNIIMLKNIQNNRQPLLEIFNNITMKTEEEKLIK